MANLDALAAIWEKTARSALTANANKVSRSKKEDLVDSTVQCANCGKEQQSTSHLKPEPFFTATIPQCSHVFCKRCLDNILLLRKTNFDCPKCGINVTESKLTEKSLDEIFADLDTYHRRKVKEVFNKREEDFDASEDGANQYREYEELVEDLIYNLNNGIDVEQTWKKINDYKASNASTIIAISERNNYELLEQERVIAEKEKERKLKQMEFEKIDSIENQKSKDEARQRNSALLGDKITYKSLLDISKTTGANESQAAIHPNKDAESKGPNLAAALLFHRQPPRVLRGTGSSPEEAGARSAKHDRAVHLAGGYDYIEYSKRNWQEIINGIGWIQEHRLSAAERRQDEAVRWRVPWI